MATHVGSNTASYKARKEAFVSNLSGGSITEINLVTLVAPAAVLLWTTLQLKHRFFTPYTAAAFVVDSLLNVGGILFAITLYASAPILLNLLLILPALVLLVGHTTKPRRVRGSGVTDSVQHAASDQSPSSTGTPQRSFLTHYRGAMMVVTCLAILAVDFRVFPRRFAKAENWGTSLMDLGVGSFVFSAGVISARSVLRSSPGFRKTSKKSFLCRLATATKHSIPLLVLGFIRLYSVKGLDYAEHVTEYGVHWNFFFTLGLLPPFVDISDLLTTNLHLSYDFLALIFAVVYEIVLTFTGLKAYILISPRGPSLLSKNREGIFSFVGYLAIFLSGRNTGITILSPPPPSKPTRATATTNTKLLRKLLFQSLASSTLYYLTTSIHIFSLTPSRRLANLPYTLWISAFNTFQLFLFASIEFLLQPQSSTTPSNNGVNDASRVLAAFNKNGLMVFLIANLLTGLVNLTVDTLVLGDARAMGVLLAYAAVVTGVTVGLDVTGWKIKL